MGYSMNDYAEEKQSRILMFERWLKLMVQHRGDERHLDCAITFLVNPPRGYDSPWLGQGAKAMAALAATIRDSPGWSEPRHSLCHSLNKRVGDDAITM